MSSRARFVQLEHSLSLGSESTLLMLVMAGLLTRPPSRCVSMQRNGALLEECTSIRLADASRLDGRVKSPAMTKATACTQIFAQLRTIRNSVTPCVRRSILHAAPQTRGPYEVKCRRFLLASNPGWVPCLRSGTRVPHRARDDSDCCIGALTASSKGRCRLCRLPFCRCRF